MTTSADARPGDVIVVGGGPAGATAAALLAKRGHDVLLLDSGAPARPRSGESLITGVLSVIEELGLTERVDAAFARKHGTSLVWAGDPDPSSVAFAESGPYEYAHHVERDAFDELLRARARELGVRVVTDATVTGTVMADGRVAGVRWRPSSGAGDAASSGAGNAASSGAGDAAPSGAGATASSGAGDAAPSGTGGAGAREARARMVIDASGHARVLARGLTPVALQEDLPSAAVAARFAPCGRLPGAQESHILIEASGDGWFWGIPHAGAEMSVGYVAPGGLPAEPRAAGEVLTARLRETQVLKRLLGDGEPVGGSAGGSGGGFAVSRERAHISARFHGPGWLVVGDAAGFIDPLFSSGVWLGMSGAWLAARAVDAALRDPDAAGRELGRYEGLYRRLLTDMLGYVRYFYDPARRDEDRFERAQSAMEVVTGQSRVAFVALVAGITALPEADEAAVLETPASR